MRRYRVLHVDFDSRATILDLDIEENWEEPVKALWERNKNQIREELYAQFGPLGGHKKVANFRALGPAPWSVLSFHNKFLSQARHAFVIGAHYPALTGACALGERILNHLVLALRDRFKTTAEYKRVYRKASFDDWNVPIDTLVAWGVFRDEVAEEFRKLRDVRHKSIHFRPETDANDRAVALDAIKLLSHIVELQFGTSHELPWIIPGVRGASFLKAAVIADPFIEVVYLPNCVLVGPDHRLERTPGGSWRALDIEEYPAGDISDEEFVAMYNQRQETGPAA